MYQNDDEVVTDICMNCSIGRVRISSQPFLKLYHGQLFTIPDAVCYQCDTCNALEYDDSNFEIINSMMFAARAVSQSPANSQGLPIISDEDQTQDQKPPQL